MGVVVRPGQAGVRVEGAQLGLQLFCGQGKLLVHSSTTFMWLLRRVEKVEMVGLVLMVVWVAQEEKEVRGLSGAPGEVGEVVMVGVGEQVVVVEEDVEEA